MKKPVPPPPTYKNEDGRLISSETTEDFIDRILAKPLFDFGLTRWFRKKREDLLKKAGVKRQPPKF